MVVKGVADKEMEANKWSKQMEQTNGTWDGTPKSVRVRTRGVWSWRAAGYRTFFMEDSIR